MMMKTTTTKRKTKAPGTAWIRLAAGGGAAATLAILALAPPAGAQDRDFRWDGRLEPGQVLEVKGVHGTVEARATEGPGASVVAEKHGRRSDPDEVRVEVLEHADGVTICAIYPHPRRTNRCQAGDEHETHVKDNDVRVDFSVRVPPGVRFRGETVNGDVDVRDLDGDVTVRTVNGDVEVSTRGSAEARTVNGSIRASMGRGGDAPLRFSTVNGQIELDVPDDVDADVEASWVNGGLETDVPLTLQGGFSRRRAEGRLGSGGALLRLKTVNGSIRIR